MHDVRRGAVLQERCRRVRAVQRWSLQHSCERRPHNCVVPRNVPGRVPDRLFCNGRHGHDGCVHAMPGWPLRRRPRSHNVCVRGPVSSWLVLNSRLGDDGGMHAVPCGYPPSSDWLGYLLAVSSGPVVRRGVECSVGPMQRGRVCYAGCDVGCVYFGEKIDDWLFGVRCLNWRSLSLRLLLDRSRDHGGLHTVPGGSLRNSRRSNNVCVLWALPSWLLLYSRLGDDGGVHTVP